MLVMCTHNTLPPYFHLYRFAKSIPPPRTNFDDFFNAMLAVFQVSVFTWVSTQYGRDWAELTFRLLLITLITVGIYTLYNHVNKLSRFSRK